MVSSPPPSRLASPGLQGRAPTPSRPGRPRRPARSVRSREREAPLERAARREHLDRGSCRCRRRRRLRTCRGEPVRVGPELAVRLPALPQPPAFLNAGPAWPAAVAPTTQVAATRRAAQAAAPRRLTGRALPRWISFRTPFVDRLHDSLELQPGASPRLLEHRHGRGVEEVQDGLVARDVRRLHVEDVRAAAGPSDALARARRRRLRGSRRRTTRRGISACAPRCACEAPGRNRETPTLWSGLARRRGGRARCASGRRACDRARQRRLDGLRRHEQVRGDLAIRHPRGDEVCDALLGRGEVVARRRAAPDP